MTDASLKHNLSIIFDELKEVLAFCLGEKMIISVRGILICLFFVATSATTTFSQGLQYTDQVDFAAVELNTFQSPGCDCGETSFAYAASAAGVNPNFTTRSFLFGWPGQSSDDLRLDLNEPLVTDRPDFTEASSTVGRGVSQFEIGYTYFNDAAGGVTTDAHSYPEILLRQGLFRDWFELRVAYNAGSVNDGVTTINGSEDLYVGAKIGLTPQSGFLPEMAIIPQATFATGSDEFTTGESLFGVNWLYSWTLSDTLSFAGSTQFNESVDGVTGNQYIQWAQSLAIGKSITDQFGTYLEWFALFPDDADTDGVEQFLNGGFSYLLSDNIQWDIRAGVGLNEGAQDFFAGTGLSIRFR